MKRLVLLLFVIYCSKQLSAQSEYYVYPPLCDVKSLGNVKFDSTYTVIYCNFISDTIDRIYVRSNLIDQESVIGWIIVYSAWDRNDISPDLVCLNEKDKGGERIVNLTEKTKIRGIFMRDRPIIIINPYTCKLYYLEDKDLFQLYIDENPDDDGW